MRRVVLGEHVDPHEEGDRVVESSGDVGTPRLSRCHPTAGYVALDPGEDVGAGEDGLLAHEQPVVAPQSWQVSQVPARTMLGPPHAGQKLPVVPGMGGGLT